MTCCCTPGEDTGRLFSLFAKWYRIKFRLFGFEQSQKQLLSGIQQTSIQGASLLDIGCGTGHLHRALLKAGAGSLIGIELATGMTDQAVALSAKAGMAGITDYRTGDFTALAPDLGQSDISILDKVVCCYPDAEGLLSHALDCTRCVIALTYPRNRRLTRTGLAVANFILGFTATTFRPWIHDPQAIAGWITERGFHLDSRQLTIAWQTEVWVKS